MDEAWIRRQTATPEDRRLFEQERLILEVTDQLYGAMEDASLTKADVARSIGTSRAHVTQTFRGTRNLTLRTVSDLAWACGQRVVIALEPLRDGAFISAPVHCVRPAERQVVHLLDPGLAVGAEVADLDLAS